MATKWQQLSYKFSTECAGEKKSENRLIFCEDMDKGLQLTFLGHPVYFIITARRKK